MAVGDEASLRPTEGLLLQDGRKHYRTPISPIHWQLRSLVSADRDGIVYFPAGMNNTHITRLNTKTNEFETIKVISFHPRCLVACGGWICCGGESGEFTVIHETTSSAPTEDPRLRDSSQSTVSPDPSLTSEPSMSELRRDMLSIVEQITGSAKNWSATNSKFGAERVNCITIWLPSKGLADQPKPGVYTSPVAVLANNDRTVTVVQLHSSTILDRVEFPDCVNRGVISPDGSLLVAICDDPFLYVYVRSAGPGKRVNHFNWVPLPRIRLQDQSLRDVSDRRGSFAACFSPSGKYLAVGTQYGNIYVFDVAAIANPDQDPLVTYFNSARAPDEYGAVRDMAFSPGPYDILAWSEHRGRFGVADARTNFTRRQIISIEDHDTHHHVPLNDQPTTIDPSLLDPRSDQSAGGSPSLPSFMRHSTRLQTNADNPNDPNRRFSPLLSAEENAILQTIRGELAPQEGRERERDQREQRDPQTARGAAALRSPVYFSRVSRQPIFLRISHGRLRDLSAEFEQNLTDMQRDRVQRLIDREESPQIREMMRSTMMPPEYDRERRAPTPRRRSSITQALAINRVGNADGPAISRENTLWGQIGRGTTGWSDLEALYSMSGGEAPHDIDNRRDTNRVRRAAVPILSDFWADDNFGFRRMYGRVGHRGHQQHADDTSGLAWSEDGRTLYVGAEDGIYEFQMNMVSRKLFPAVSLR